tara:strand:- start:155 stop:526 length:372 start_codon:yes stop_codon:yes gene_type:complete
MLDTIRFFQRLADEVPKLYVLGGMEELGDGGPGLHRETGANLRLDSADQVLLVGEKASWMREGILTAGTDAEAVNVAQDVEEARGIVAAFEGAVLLKGSRVNALETLVPEWATDEENADHAQC